MAKFRLGPLNGRGGRMLVGYETETIQYRAIVTVERICRMVSLSFPTALSDLL